MPWGQTEKAHWFHTQYVQRSYQADVVSTLTRLSPRFEILQYGALALDPETYPLFLLKSKHWNPQHPTLLITGGVHGYETSGVHGALAFLEQGEFNTFNLLCAPCISPWAYETINRWNPQALDPNRHFIEDSPVEECRLFWNAIQPYQTQILVHIDLHETTDTDNSVFRPALEARDGVSQAHSEIPDGFYVVGDTENPQLNFQAAIIESVKKVTHIAQPDAQGCLIGEPLIQEGVILYPLKKWALCTSFSAARYTSTTEVYPDSSLSTPALCIQAQVAAIQGGISFLRENTYA